MGKTFRTHKGTIMIYDQEVDIEVTGMGDKIEVKIHTEPIKTLYLIQGKGNVKGRSVICKELSDSIDTFSIGEIQAMLTRVIEVTDEIKSKLN